MLYLSTKFLFRFTFFFFLPIPVFGQTYLPGNTYFDNNGYVEYLAGNVPVVISVPHGGYLEPSSISDRSCSGCSYLRDSYTQELAREMQAAFFQKTGCYPHIVINLLHRKKFDANRSIGTAADGDPTVEQSWYAYHDFLDSAKATIMQSYGRGLFLDLHGHAHSIQRVELGYTLSKTELQLADSVLNTATYVQKSSIQTLVSDNLSNHTHAELLRGTSSFGTLLGVRGFPAVPSAAIPFPLSSHSYFTGGYNTTRHGSDDGGAIDGIQIECNQNIRFDSLNRKAFADSLVEATIEYIDVHYNDQFQGRFCDLLSNSTSVLSEKKVLIYPNPTNQQFQIISAYTILEVLIYDSLGKNIKTSKWNGNPIDIHSLEKGIYFLEFKAKDLRVGTHVLIKQ